MTPPYDKALELINEMTAFQRQGDLPILEELKLQHDITNLSAQYLCIVVRSEFEPGSDRYEYWQQVKKHLEEL